MDTTDQKLDLVKKYCDFGFRLIPLYGVDANGKCECRKKGQCSSCGKHPKLTDWPNAATNDIDTVREWYRQWPRMNLGVKLGRESNLVDIEFDDEQGAKTAERVLSNISTPTYRSRRSRHHLFRYPNGLNVGTAVRKIDGLELRMGTDKRAAQSTLPPSWHASGCQYRWEVPIGEIAIAEFPEEVVELLNSQDQSTVLTMQSDETLETHPGAIKGNRNTLLCQLVGRYLNQNGADHNLVSLALNFGGRCSPPIPEEEVLNVVTSLVRKETVTGSVRTSGISVTPFSEINPQSIDWLWNYRIALGKLTLVVGEPGLGKSFLTIDLASRITTGQEFPDGTPCSVGEVLFLTCEDGPEDTIRPRLDAHDADVTRVWHINGVTTSNGKLQFVNLQQHLPDIEAYFKSNRAIKLLVIDPLSAFLGDRVDSHKDASVRGVLGPLCQLAEKHNIAVVGVMHLNKRDAKAIHRVIGSIAFVAAARAAWLVTADEDDASRRLFLPIKNNLADTSGLAYRIEDGRCQWEEGEVFVSPDDTGADCSRLEEAVIWLTAHLDSGPQPSKNVISEAKSEGIAERTLLRAKRQLDIKSWKQDGRWVWELDKPPNQLAERRTNNGGDDVLLI